MDLKKVLAGIFVVVLFIGLIGFNTCSAKKSSATKIAPETIESMSNEIDKLTQKIYAKGLLSPQENADLIGIKIKLDNQMLLETDPELAPLYFKAGNIYKLRDMKDEATECYQTILENFADTALAPKSYQYLKDMGVDVSQFGDMSQKAAGGGDESEE